MTNLEAIEAHLTAELERVRKKLTCCPVCHGHGGLANDWGDSCACPSCKGSGKSPALLAAEEALNLCREERKRVERFDFDPGPLLADFAKDPAVVEVGHAVRYEICVRVDMSDFGRESRYRMYEKQKRWLRKMPSGVSLDVNLAEYNAPLKEEA